MFVLKTLEFFLKLSAWPSKLTEYVFLFFFFLNDYNCNDYLFFILTLKKFAGDLKKFFFTESASVSPNKKVKSKKKIFFLQKNFFKALKI